MANITKRQNKDGSVSYRIRVYAGHDLQGKPVMRSRVFRPEKGMSIRQINKALTRIVIEFEDEVKHGGCFGRQNLTVDEFLKLWLDKYAEKQLKGKTVDSYRRIVPRISAALGHIKLSALRPGHIMQFYEQLEQPGVRLDGKYKAQKRFLDAFPKGKRLALEKAAGISDRTMARIWAGECTSKATAEKLAHAAGISFTNAFFYVSGKDTLSGSSIRQYHLLLSSALGIAVKWQLLNDNPCTRVTPPKMDTPDIDFLDENGIAALMNALKDAPIQFSVITQLALFTGARRGELCALRWSDIDLESGLLSISRSVIDIAGEGLVFSPPKTKKSKRTIKLSSSAVQLLKDYKLWQSAERYKVGSKWIQQVEVMGKTVENDFLFTAWDGKPIRPGTITSWFPKFLRAHNLPPVRFHSLRHSNAALLIAAHVPVTTVAGRLGHAQVSTTTNIYAGFIRASDAKAADALTDAFTRIGIIGNSPSNHELIKFHG